MISRTVRNLLEQSGIVVGGANPWDLQVHDSRWYRRVWRDKNLGLGESYMDGWWDCRQIDGMIHRLLINGLHRKVKGGAARLAHELPAVLFNLQSAVRARIIAEQHYDLGNDLFLPLLDPNLQYSCAYFVNGDDDLTQAQINKLDLIAAKLDIQPGDRVLDIGCGWGGLARYFAQHYRCRVTAVNISREQLKHAREICRGLPVDFQDCDYRAIEGCFDKIVSVGMFEHVGRKNYRIFMEVASRCLRPAGIFLLHTIGSNISRRGCDPWINKYIFPNSMLPSIAQIGRAAEGLFVIEDIHNLGPHYDRTLMAWNQNFQRTWPELLNRYDERFKRMWEYYLLSCAGAFRARNIQLWQVLMTKHGTGTEQPCCRIPVGEREMKPGKFLDR
ncbi:cyclopropane fatty acyl phospholipid synthase [Desulfurivibrio sp. C05AmB]|uniref:cyclopropane fatty acyl phospholipid synthase n=1 Tax=Desulfurivibrio sp. C05AmB TaxID=3374371 RepID=UPI00376ED775